MLSKDCSQCLKPHVVYAVRKVGASERKFHFVLGSALFSCGVILAEFKLVDLNTEEKHFWAGCLFVLFYRGLHQLRRRIIR